MRLTKLIFILIFLQAEMLYSQTIIASSSKYVIIDTQGMEILNVGDEYNVVKRLDSNEDIRIAKVKIVKFIKGKYAAKIVAKSPNYEIEKGDLIQIGTVSSTNKNLVNYGSILGGLVAGGFGYKYRADGDDIYSKYENADTREKAMEYYDDTIEYDNKAAFGMGLGGTLLGLGVFHSLFGNAIAPPDYTSATANYTNNIVFSYGPIAAGLFTLGLGYYFHDQGNKAYDDYESASTPYDSRNYYNDSVDLDRKANATFGIGTAFVTFGVLNLISNSSSSSKQVANNLTIYPIQMADFTGIGATFSFDKLTRLKSGRGH